MVSHQQISDMIKRIKQEPEDDESPNDFKQCNGSTERNTRSKRKSTEENGKTEQKRFRHLSENGKPSIPCLMCDRYLENQDELMIHMALDHQCTPQGNRRQIGRIPKHTCQICFAKFRTLIDLFTHTALHAKQIQINGECASDIENRMVKNLVKQGTNRQYFSDIQNNRQEEIQHGTFKCECCNNVFMNRDTYAMHVMMRVKDEMCKQDDALNKSNGKDIVNEFGDSNGVIAPHNGQDFLIDVTSSVNEDEYLKTALSVADNHHKIQKEDSSNFNNVQGRKCMFCTEHFLDQDSMAMHVMSVHTTISHKQPSSKISLKKITVQSKDKASEPRNFVTVKDCFRCYYCGSIHDSQDSLAMHMLTTHKNDRANTNCSQNGNETKESRYHINENGNNNVSAVNNQDEPLNLVSEKKTDSKTSETTQNLIVEGDLTNIYDKYLPIVSQSKLNFTENRSNVRPTRSVSVPDMPKQCVSHITRNRPVSTGCMKWRESYPDHPNIITLDDNKNSPMSYSYEQPEPYIEDREHSCQYMISPQNDPLELLLQKREHAHVCSYCEIIFLNRTLYYLHMGLHNVNNPLQCNMCGKACDNIHDFSAHVIHL